MRQAVIVDGVRTPMGKHGGSLSLVRPDDLSALVIREIVRRTGIEPKDVEDVIFGCANQAGEDNRNVARMALLLADFPPEVPGQTVNRLCGSSLQAIITACQAIQTGNGEVYIAGGVESMSRAPFVFAKPEKPFPWGNITVYDSTLGWRFVNPRMTQKYRPLSMGETAECLNEQFRIPREEQDVFALRSHQRAVQAWKSGIFSEEVVPVEVPQKKGPPIRVEKDEGPREDTSLEKLSQLPPVFKENGTITAGNSSPLSDGAAAVLIMEEERAKKMGFKPYFRLVASAVAGVHPDYMGLGPVPATRKALQRANLSLTDIDLVEINEAFAVQVLACCRELNLPLEKINPNGGAIALGHPLGCSGARIVTTLIHEMRRKNYRFGLTTMCIGVGQGIAAIWEKVG
ncbi:MAG: thiolase family protein [bacterium JZ-2024 1]